MAHVEGRSVTRTDLISNASSSEPTSPIGAAYVEELSKAYGTFEDGEKPSIRLDGASAEEEDHNAVDFRLFAKKGPAKDENCPTHRIVLRSPTPVPQEPGFVLARRSNNHYFTGEASEEQARRYNEAAISGSDILKGLNTRWRGCELTWRVTVIRTRISSKVPQLPDNGLAREGNKRTRKGKKTRIAIRRRIAKADALKEQEAQDKAEKEAAKKDKRNRRNREKKIKRREKAREAKATQAGDAV